MKISIQKLPKSQLELWIELPAQEIDRHFEKAALELGKDLQVPGFRQGHLPREVIEKEVGKEKILSRAAEMAIRESYSQAILENKLEPLGQPKIEVLKLAFGNPLEFKIRIPVLPEVKLPDYKQIASQVKRKEVKVSPEDIEQVRLAKERKEREKARGEILKEIAAKSEMEIPEILVEGERKQMLENLKQEIPSMLGTTYQDYLTKINKTEPQLLDSLWSEAEQRVKSSLVLREIGKREDIEISDQELKQEMDKISNSHPQVKNLDPEQLKEYTKGILRSEKAFQLLESQNQN